MSYGLAYGDVGADVRRLQEFLRTQGAAQVSADGVFGPNTRAALGEFQRSCGLPINGILDDASWEALEVAGLVLRGALRPKARPDLGWPSRPSSLVQPTVAMTEELFGRFDFSHTPAPDNPECIEILGGWEMENIVTLHIPELDRCLFPASSGMVVRPMGRVRCHRLAAPKFHALFARWNAAGLMDRILTCTGVFHARLKRGASSDSRANLSNHAWGTAIDLNAPQNGLGHIPALAGARGCLRELVEIANELGFYWGGHFRSRPDGMHFELARLD